MANFIAKAVLNNNDSATIWLYSDTDWSSLNWSSKIESLGFPHSTLMFKFTNSGTGILEDSKTLRIELSPVPPGVFSITTNQGVKNFELIDAVTHFSPVWTKTNDFELDSSGSKLYNIQSTVYLSNQYQQYFYPHQYGFLEQNGERKGIYIGTGFAGIYKNTKVWPFGGVLFHNIIWYEEPSLTPQPFILKTTLNGNKRSITLEKEITISDTEVINPNDPFYIIPNKSKYISNRTIGRFIR